MLQFFDIIYYFILTLIVTMGLFVATNNWSSLNNKIFFFVTLGSIGWVVSLHEAWLAVGNADWLTALPLMRLSYGFSVLGMSLMTVFIYFFPSPSIKVRRWAKSSYLVFTLSLFFLSSFTPYINKGLLIKNDMYINDTFGPLHFIYVLSILLNLVIAAYFSVKKYNNSTGVHKKKMSLVLSGYFAFAVMAILTNVVLPLFDIYIIQSYSQFLIVLFLIPTFFALSRYRFFNFSNASLNFLRKIITYSLYLATVTFCYILLYRFLDPGILRGILSALAAIIVFRFAENKIPPLETSSLKQLKRVLTHLKSKVYYCNTYQELEKLIEEVFLIDLNFVNARIFVVRKNLEELELAVYKENEFTQSISRYSKDLVIKDEIDFRRLNESTKNRLKKEMGKMNADLCMPLFSEKNLIGFLILKRKDTDNSYSNEELQEVYAVKKDLEIGLMNILLKTNLQEENDLMKAIIDEKTKELQKKIKQINELAQQQADFIAVTAHEFRTPLSIAAFQLEDMLASKNLKSKQLEELQIIESSLENLKELTEKLFAVQQYDLNKVSLNLEKVELRNFLKRVYKEFLPLIKEKNQTLKLNINLKTSVSTKIDKVQMRQVLHNLLKNASKFTPEKGLITLSLKTTKNEALISVEDNGPGIPDELKKSVFEKFRTKASGAGIGLGLYLCKKIIELHKGKIWVEDTRKRGACFWIELPLNTV